MARFLARHVRASLDLIWPPLCPSCDARADRPDTLFCEACWRALHPVTPGDPGDLLVGTPPVFAAFSVDALFLRVLSASKYGRYRRVGLRLARHAAERLAPALPRGVLLPVPIASDRRRERGFNQTEDFATVLAAAAGAAFRTDWLLRRRGGPALAGMAREKRARALEGAFRAGAAFPGDAAGPLLLVDDVVTTGSTATACAGALEAAGNRPVGVVAMGRAFSPRDDRAEAEGILARL